MTKKEKSFVSFAVFLLGSIHIQATANHRHDVEINRSMLKDQKSKALFVSLKVTSGQKLKTLQPLTENPLIARHDDSKSMGNKGKINKSIPEKHEKILKPETKEQGTDVKGFQHRTTLAWKNRSFHSKIYSMRKNRARAAYTKLPKQRNSEKEWKKNYKLSQSRALDHNDHSQGIQKDTKQLLQRQSDFGIQKDTLAYERKEAQDSDQEYDFRKMDKLIMENLWNWFGDCLPKEIKMGKTERNSVNCTVLNHKILEKYSAQCITLMYLIKSLPC